MQTALQKAIVIILLLALALGCNSKSDNNLEESVTLIERTTINNGYVVTGIKSYTANDELEYSGTYTLDGTLNTIYVKDDLSVENPIVGEASFNDTGDLVKRTWFSDTDVIQSETYNRSADGRLLSIKYTVPAREWVDTFSYDNFERVSTRETAESLEFKTTTQFTYDDQGLLASVVEELGENEGTETTTFTYSTDGRRTGKSYDYTSDGSQDATEAYTYDTFGNIITIEFFDGLGGLDRRQEITYEATTEPVYNALKFSEYYYPTGGTSGD